MGNKFRQVGCLILLLLCGAITGCDYLNPDPHPPYTSKTAHVGLISTAGGAAVGAYTMGLGAPLGAAAGGVIGTTIGHFIQKNQTILERLADNKVQVEAIGDNVLLIIPSDLIFYPDSPHLDRSFDPLLNDIAALLRGYEKITVKVAAYSDNVGDPIRKKALTEQQAHSVANYLWKQDIDTRILYSVGYGSKNQIANNLTMQGKAQNRRIEITLRQLPDGFW